MERYNNFNFSLHIFSVFLAALSIHFSSLLTSWAHPASYPMVTGGSFPREKSGRCLKLTTHLQLVPMSKKRGPILPLPHTPSWRSAYLVKYRDNFDLTHVILCIKRLNKTPAFHSFIHHIHNAVNFRLLELCGSSSAEYRSVYCTDVE
jgi:hypothetical protein